MSKRPKLIDIPGLGPKMEEKLREAGIKTVLNLSRAKADKLAAKVSGLSEAGAQKLIAAAQEIIESAAAPKKAPAKGPKKPAEEKPKKAPPKEPKKPAEEKPKKEKAPKKRKAPPKKAPRKKPARKEPVREVKPVKRDEIIASRLFRLAREIRRRQPSFRHEQSHRWVRVKDSWRKVRGIDSATREKRRGRPAMVSAGYRKPRAVRGIHPSGYIEVLVSNASELEGLDPDIHAVRIGGTVGQRKRQEILKRADTMLIRVLNPSVPEVIEEEELFSELDDLEVD